MQRLARLVRRSPWLCNVGLYGSLFAAGDAVQQRLRLRPGQRADWAQTRRVALVALTFHANFNYLWLRMLERLLPGRAPAAVLAKVSCDQLVGAPVAILAFYSGMRLLQGKEDIFADCRQKFWNTYKTGLMYWPFVQAAENGATGVELDLEFTADGVPILMHDETVDRTTDGSGSLRELTFADIRQFNPAAKHRLWRDYRGEKIPTLKEAVLESLHHDLIIYFDVKGHADKAVAVLTQLYLEYPRLYNTSVVCSFMPDVVYKMKQADRNVITALTHRPWSFSHYGDGKPRYTAFWKHYLFMAFDVIMDWSMHNFLWHLCGISVFLMQKNYISQDYVNRWSSKGVHVVAWTVNTLAEKMYYENVLQTTYMTDSLLEDCDPHY